MKMEGFLSTRLYAFRVLRGETEPNLRKSALMEKTTMTCPKCGGAMNHHADKVVYSAIVEEPHVPLDVFGGIVHETHACRACGAIETRRAQ